MYMCILVCCMSHASSFLHIQDTLFFVCHWLYADSFTETDFGWTHSAVLQNMFYIKARLSCKQWQHCKNYKILKRSVLKLICMCTAVKPDELSSIASVFWSCMWSVYECYLIANSCESASFPTIHSHNHVFLLLFTN